MRFFFFFGKEIYRYYPTLLHRSSFPHAASKPFQYRRSAVRSTKPAQIVIETHMFQKVITDGRWKLREDTGHRKAIQDPESHSPKCEPEMLAEGAASAGCVQVKGCRH